MIWYEVTGRGSGKKLDGIHVANVDQPYGQMTTGCGVAISSAVVVTRPRPGSTCRACRRSEKAVAHSTASGDPDEGI